MKPFLKLSCVTGLESIVLDELARYPDYTILGQGHGEIYTTIPTSLTRVELLKSITHAYLAYRDAQINPLYIYRHKSLLGDLIHHVVAHQPNRFTTFSLSCAGSDSDEVTSIKRYVRDTYTLTESPDADLKIAIGKLFDNTWELSVSITPRPLSTRSYRLAHVVGGLNPTIAYAMNTQAVLNSSGRYLNIFSGGATLLIEVGLMQLGVHELVGFDNDGTRIAESVKNIKQAGLIKQIRLVRADIFDTPELGLFDSITSDLPFGMQISKDTDLEKLYVAFISYCENHLTTDGRLVVYTTEYELFEKLMPPSRLTIIRTFSLSLVTSVNSYLHPKIFVCAFKDSIHEQQ